MKKFFLLAFMPFVLMACSGSDDKKEEVPDLLPRTDFSVDIKKTVDIGGSGSLAIKNPFIASYEDGWLTGLHVGKTEAVYNGSQKVMITVNGTLKYIDYPITDWGASKSAVLSQQKAGDPLDSKDGDMEFFVVKSGSKIKYTYGYSFKNGQLASSMIMVPSTDTDILVEWLAQKYFMLMTGDGPNGIFSGGFDGLKESEATTLLGVTLESVNTSTYVSPFAYMILFAPINAASRANNNIAEKYLNALDS